ncbi:hypothetical protein GCM10007298_04180 [Williamsia phyllosphaerae]|uniref:Uncharacterized protein n=1 Tax=Williamsia phyllosphaerae TaxID=885042 RepID=A0ABQ1U9T0_9NOCA|nr:hypothetical protein GCM10007298_04180 [Williamsia phyllosphaerae]
MPIAEASTNLRWAERAAERTTTTAIPAGTSVIPAVTAVLSRLSCCTNDHRGNCMSPPSRK